VPRAKYIKPPGPLPAIEQVRRSKFRFRDGQRRKLAKLLPRKLASLLIPSDYLEEVTRAPHAPNWKLKTIEDAAVYITEAAISSHLTAGRLPSDRMPRAANSRVAIRDLRKALRPFTHGWMDEETADIVPADLDARLAARVQVLAKLRCPPVQRRLLEYLCQEIASNVTALACAHCGSISEQNVIRYIDFALTCAGIEHPDFVKHRDRLAALVFPTN
jgi:hypothetical protein